MARALIALTVCCACASGGEVAAVPVTCSSFFSGRFCSGTLPQSELGAGIEDVRGGSGAVGRHYFCRPESGWNGRTVLFLVGTSGEPSGGVPFLIHACTRGFAGLAPMYEDALAAREVCRDDPGCYGPMRREVVFGDNRSGDPLRVDPANSVLHRMDTLLSRLAAAEPGFPHWKEIQARFAGRDLSSFAVSGHSQGSGHALLLAHEFAVERAIMFGGVPDRTRWGTAQSGPVDWISSWTQGPRTASGRLFGFNHQGDAIAADADVTANFDLLAMAPQTCGADGSLASSCRRLRILAGCTGTQAHQLTMVPEFGTAGDPCAITPGGSSQNFPAWDFLLLGGAAASP